MSRLGTRAGGAPDGALIEKLTERVTASFYRHAARGVCWPAADIRHDRPLDPEGARDN